MNYKKISLLVKIQLIFKIKTIDEMLFKIPQHFLQRSFFSNKKMRNKIKQLKSACMVKWLAN